MRRRIGGDFLGRSFGNNLSPPTGPTFRTEVDNPVCGLDDVQVVLDDDDGVAVIAQTLQYVQKLLDIVEVQAGRGLVQDVQGFACVPFGQLLGQLDPLCFAPPDRVTALWPRRM